MEIGGAQHTAICRVDQKLLEGRQKFKILPENTAPPRGPRRVFGRPGDPHGGAKAHRASTDGRRGPPVPASLREFGGWERAQRVVMRPYVQLRKRQGSAHPLVITLRSLVVGAGFSVVMWWSLQQTCATCRLSHSTSGCDKTIEAGGTIVLDESFRTGRRARNLHGESATKRQRKLRKRDHKSTHLLDLPWHSALKEAYVILMRLERGGGAGAQQNTRNMPRAMKKTVSVCYLPGPWEPHVRKPGFI